LTRKLPRLMAPWSSSVQNAPLKRSHTRAAACAGGCPE
jgi:hypothetical protein